MATIEANCVLQRLRQVVTLPDGAGFTDGQLLGCFIEQHDDAAFAAIVRRHGPMVLEVCRRVLRDHHDAEDAFQATFLVLVRKAASIAPRALVGNWLYGVAYRTALKARSVATKRRDREKQVADMPEPESAPPDLLHNLRPLLDPELNLLPDKYRAAIVLCELEGKTRKEAARQLGWPEGTVAGRLARGRALLAKRLARQGLKLSAGSLSALLAQQSSSACVPAALMAVTIKAANLHTAGEVASVFSGRVLALTVGGMHTTWLAKLRVLAAVLLGLATITCVVMATGWLPSLGVGAGTPAGPAALDVPNASGGGDKLEGKGGSAGAAAQKKAQPITKHFLQGNWKGAKDPIAVELWFEGADTTALVQQPYSNPLGEANVSGTENIGASLVVVEDQQAGCVNLMLHTVPTSGEKKGQLQVLHWGRIEGAEGGTIKLKIFPVYKYRPVEGLVLRRVGDTPPALNQGTGQGNQTADQPGKFLVAMDKKKAIIAGQLDAGGTLFLRIGAAEGKLVWTDAFPKAGAFKAIVEHADTIKLEDGSFGAGIVYSVEVAQVKSQTNIPVPKLGPLPAGQLSFRDKGKIVEKDGVITFADITTADGKSVPVSIGITKKE